MTLTIEIAPEIESCLETEAKRSGMSKNDLVKIVIEERFAPKEEKRQNHLPEGFTPRYIGKAEMRDFSGDDQWLRENREKYQGKHVATHGNRLIAHGENLKIVINEIREKGFPDALLTFVEPFDTPPFAGV